jgi:hypothetical protein
MTKSELDSWRKRVPFVICGLGLLPVMILGTGDPTKVKLLAPAIAMVFAFFYVGADLRRPV